MWYLLTVVPNTIDTLYISGCKVLLLVFTPKGSSDCMVKCFYVRHYSALYH